MIFGVLAVALMAIVAILVLGAPLWLFLLALTGALVERRRRKEESETAPRRDDDAPR